jgi:hypothetical protein
MKKTLILLAAATAFSCSDKQSQQQQSSIEEMQALELQKPSSSATAASSSIESSAESVAESSSSAFESSSSATESSSSISNAFDAKVFEKIQTFYSKHIFGNESVNDSVIAQYCTKALAKKLRDAYNSEFSDGGGYAVWKFRSNAQDGEDIQEIEKIEPLGKNKYRIHYNDMGNKGTHTITVVANGDKILFDKLQ